MDSAKIAPLDSQAHEGILSIQLDDEIQRYLFYGSNEVVLLDRNQTLSRKLFGVGFENRIRVTMRWFSYVGAISLFLSCLFFFSHRTQIYSAPLPVFAVMAAIVFVYQSCGVLLAQYDILVMCLTSFDLFFLLCNVLVNSIFWADIFGWDGYACASFISLGMSYVSNVFLDAYRLPKPQYLDLPPVMSQRLGENALEPIEAGQKYYLSYSVFHNIIKRKRDSVFTSSATTLRSKIGHHVTIMRQLSSIPLVIAPLSIGVVFLIMVMIALQLDAMHGLKIRQFSIYVYDWENIDVFRLSCLNILVFNARRLYYMMTDPSAVFCYRRRNLALPLSSAWRTVLAQSHMSPMEMLNHVDKIEAMKEIDAKHTTHRSTNSRAKRILMSVGPISQGITEKSSSNVEDSLIMQENMQAIMTRYETTRKSVPLHTVLGWRTKDDMVKVNDNIVISLNDIRANDLYLIFSLPEGNKLFTVKTLISELFPMASSKLKYYIARYHNVSSTVVVLSVPLLVASLVYYHVALEVVFAIVSITSTIGLSCLFLFMSKSIMSYLMKSFEAWFILVNLFCLIIAALDLCDYSGSRLVGGIAYLVLSAIFIVVSDAVPISFEKLTHHLQKISTESVVKINFPSIYAASEHIDYLLEIRNRALGLENFKQTKKMTGYDSLHLLRSMRNEKVSLRNKNMQEITMLRKIFPKLGIPFTSGFILAILCVLVLLRLNLLWGANIRTYKTVVGKWSTLGVFQATLTNILIFLLKRVYSGYFYPLHSTGSYQKFYRIPLDEQLFTEIVYEQMRLSRAKKERIENRLRAEASMLDVDKPEPSDVKLQDVE